MISRERAIDLLDLWRQAFGGIEVVLIWPGVTTSSARSASIDFMLGSRGFSWFDIGGSGQGHHARADRIEYDNAFDMLAITDESKGWTLEIQPLKTPEIIDMVNQWKEDHPSRVNLTRNLRELAG